MNLLPQLDTRVWAFKATFSKKLAQSNIEPTIIYASKNKLLLTLLFSSTELKETVKGCFTTKQEVLSHLTTHITGILLCTIDLEDSSGDSLMQEALAIQPNLRTVLMVDHDNFSEAEARSWNSNVIIAAKDMGDDDEPWRMAMQAAIARTSFRSKSIAQIATCTNNTKTVSLTKRDKDILQCFALGLSNAESAERLYLSPHSTKTYSKRLLAKLNVNNRHMALLKAFGRLPSEKN